MDDFIPAPLYTEMRNRFVRVCVDLLLHDGARVLLGLRNNEPDKGEWSVFGGMLKHGESVEQGIQRKAREELGIEVIMEGMIGIYNYVEDWQHDLCLAYLVGSKDKTSYVLDSQHSQCRWFDKIEPSMTEYTKNLIVDAGLYHQSKTYNIKHRELRKVGGLY